MIKAILFDLDGTLLNTLKDLNEACNYTLKYFNLPLITINQTKQFIGNGVKVLLKRSAFNADIDYALAYEVFKKYYRNHIKDYTTVYDGIIDVLKFIKSKNIKIAVTSNKYQEGVEILVNHLLSPYIDIALGSSETVKVKPHPDMVNIVLDKLNVSSDQCLFIHSLGSSRSLYTATPLVTVRISPLRKSSIRPSNCVPSIRPACALYQINSYELDDVRP